MSQDFATSSSLDPKKKPAFPCQHRGGPQLVLRHPLPVPGDVERAAEQLRKGGAVAPGLATAGANAARSGGSG